MNILFLLIALAGDPQYPTSIVTSPSLGTPVRDEDPFVTFGFTRTRMGSAQHLEWASYKDEWYVAQRYDDWGLEIHLNAVWPRLPITLFWRLFTADHPTNPLDSLQADVFGAAIELPFSERVKGQIEVARGYYSGQTATGTSFKLEGNFPVLNATRPFISLGGSLTCADDSRHVRWHSTLADEGIGRFAPQLFANGWGTLHFNGINRRIPLYLTISTTKLSDLRLHHIRSIDTMSLGIEQSFLKFFTAKFDFGKIYYAGAQANEMSFSITTSFTLDDLFRP